MNTREIMVLTIICIISGFCLFAVHNLVKERIEKTENTEMIRLLSEIFPSSEFAEENGIYLARSKENGELEGYIAMAEGKGYGGSISLMIGIHKDGTIKKVKILKQSETPGLGARITEENFLAQFEGKSVDEVMLKRDGGTIDAISGATISSRAVVEAVREKMLELAYLWGSAG
ncbi:MAG: RnfABCDGE type electron transport complex subunit G [Candidatus Hadarchaeales archaeon]